MISFGLEDSSDWKFLVYGFPTSGARSRSGSNSGNVISWGFGFLLCWFELWIRHFTIILVVLNFSNCGFLLYFVYPLSFWDKKGEYFLFWIGNVFSNWSSVFLYQNGQRGSLLVFYIGNILVDKNTSCNGCFFFFFLERVCISKPVKCFLSQNGQRRSLLEFYTGNILVDKNTLCNSCFLTGLSALI
jgi:hypothetical protein